MTNETLTHLIGIMLQNQTPRVWSLIVSIFGDLARAPGARLSGASVNAITLCIGIKPEATRVALHRLRKEGWIDSQRQGRETSYGLTTEGRRESARASVRIYDAPLMPDAAWVLVAEPGTRKSWPNGATQIAPQVAIAQTAPKKGEFLAIPVTHQAHIPDWVGGSLCPNDLQSASQNLSSRLGQLQLALPAQTPITPVQIAVLRVLIVHEWRRVILRAPNVPDALMPKGWQGVACRARFTALLDRLPAPDLQTLDAAIAAHRAA